MSLNSLKKVIINLLTTKNQLYAILLLILFYIVVRVPVWFYPVDSDHWIFQFIGQNWLTGKGILYVDFWDHKPPVIFLLNGIISLLTGSNLFLFRIVLTVLNILEIYLFYFLIKKLKLPSLSENKGLIILTGLYALVRNFSQIASSGNNTENFGVILMLITFIQLLNFGVKTRYLPLLYIGVCFGFIFWLKANMTLLFLPVFGLLAYKLFTIWKSEQLFISIVKLCTILFTPWFLLTLLILGYFGNSGYLSELWIGSFGYSAKYVQVSFRGALSDTKTFLFILFPLLITLVLPIIGWFRKFQTKQINSIDLLLISSSIMGLVYLGISGTYYPYYVLVFLPVILISTAIGHFNLSGWIKKLSTIIISIGLLISMGISFKQPLNFFYGEVSNLQSEYYQIADYIRTNTNKDDRIFTYIYGASLYGLSERQSTTKYLSASFMLLDYREKLGFGINQQVLADLSTSSKRPKLIVMYKDKNPETNLYARNQPIQDYLMNNYQTIKKQFDTLEIRSNSQAEN